MSSDRAKHWAWSQRREVSRSELLLLLAMADNVGETLICYASLATLTDFACMSERTAQRCLDRLVEIGKLERTDRPGRTTVFKLKIPADFGSKVAARKGRKTPDTVTGVAGSGAGSGAASTPDTPSGVTPDTMAGVQPPTNCQGPPSESRGTPDKMAGESFLNTTLLNPSQSARTRAGPGRSPARADESQPERTLGELISIARSLGLPDRGQRESEERFRKRVERDGLGDLFLLNNRCAQLKISPRTQSETLEDVRRRIRDADDRELQARLAAVKGQNAAGDEVRT